MPLPPLLILADEDEYHAYYDTHYVNGPPVTTFDGIRVAFYPENFRHAFFRDSTPTSRDKAHFDVFRAQRMNWIPAILGDPAMEIRRDMRKPKVRRKALEPSTPYVVIIQPDRRNPTRARFITAFRVDSVSALSKIRSNPPW